MFNNKITFSKYTLYSNSQFKSSMHCFALFENRFVEAFIYNYNKVSYIDFGFKYLNIINLKNKKIKYLIFKTMFLKNLYNDINLNCVNYKNDFVHSFMWSILKKAYRYKCILKGKILNSIRFGFSVGICGLIGFLPKKFFLSKNNSSLFSISSVDLLKKTFILSQRDMNKFCTRVVFKLSSKIMYISRN